MPGYKSRILRIDRLREAREARGLTQEELASRLGYSTSEQNRYENGKREPSPDRINKMALELGVSMSYLVGLSDEPNDNLRMEDLSDTEKQLIERFRAMDVEGMMRVALNNTPPTTHKDVKPAKS